MPGRTLKQVDVLRHELKALRYILDNFHSGKLTGAELPPRGDFLSEQSRRIYDAIVQTQSRAAAAQRIGELELDSVDIESFLSLDGGHYYTYPALVRERAEEMRAGRLRIEGA